MKFIRLLLLICCSTVNDVHAESACLQYAPVRMVLAGKLVQKTFPGRPNYESIAEGDEPETHFYLVLKNKVCVDADAKGDGVNFPQAGINLVQLVLDEDGYRQLKPSLGKSVKLSGQLFAAHTAHHHATLLMNKVSIVDSSDLRRKK